MEGFTTVPSAMKMVIPNMNVIMSRISQKGSNGSSSTLTAKNPSLYMGTKEEMSLFFVVGEKVEQ